MILTKKMELIKYVPRNTCVNLRIETNKEPNLSASSMFCINKKAIGILIFLNIALNSLVLIAVSQMCNSVIVNSSAAMGNVIESVNRINCSCDYNLNLKNELHKFEDAIASFQQDVLEITESDCGGIIKIPTYKESYLLQYQLNRNYKPNKNCLWIVENTHNSIRSQLNLKVELISHGFKGNTGLYAFKWNRETSLTSEEITSGKEHELSAEGLYFSFTSDENSTGGTGFLLRITVTQSEVKTHGYNLFFRTSPGNHIVSGYQNGDQISIAINPSKPITFSVDHINSEEKKDKLTVYEIMSRGKFIPRASLSGKLKNTLFFSTSGPILAIFTSDYSGIDRGFGISWTAYAKQ